MNEEITQAMLDSVYDERNRLVAAFARAAQLMGWRVGLIDHEGSKEDWDPDWLNVVVIETPQGQVSWHIHQRELPRFAFLKRIDVKWDKHTTAEKYERLEQWARANVRPAQ